MAQTASYLVLEKEDWEEADKLAHERRELAVRLERPPRNGAPQSIVPDIIGTRGEMAGWCYLRPILWHKKTVLDVHGLCDYEVGDLKIDAVTRSQAHYDLVVQRDDDPLWVYFLIRAHEHPKYEIAGWCFGHEAQQPRFWKEYVPGRPAFFVPSTNPIMKEPFTLLDQVRQRQRLFDLSA